MLHRRCASSQRQSRPEPEQTSQSRQGWPESHSQCSHSRRRSQTQWARPMGWLLLPLVLMLLAGSISGGGFSGQTDGPRLSSFLHPPSLLHHRPHAWLCIHPSGVIMLQAPLFIAQSQWATRSMLMESTRTGPTTAVLPCLGSRTADARTTVAAQTPIVWSWCHPQSLPTSQMWA